MGPGDRARRLSAGARRAGYGVAIGFSAALLIILNGSPGWQAIPFLTSATDQVLWLVNLSLAAGMAANVVYLVQDSPGVKLPGDLVTTGIGLVTAIRIWQVFPFDLSSGWSTAGAGAAGHRHRRLLRRSGGPDRVTCTPAHRPHPAYAHRTLMGRHRLGPGMTAVATPRLAGQAASISPAR